MTNQAKGIVARGAALLWRRQRVLWWLFAANFVTGFVASTMVRSQLRVLDTSRTASETLFHQMNVFRLTEMFTRPEGIPSAIFGGSMVLVFGYFLILLFTSGGVLESLYTDRPVRFGEFLGASSEFFWRMVRLLIFFALLLIPVLVAQSGVSPLTDWIGNHSDSEQLGFWVTLAIFAVLGLIAFAVRVWIDVAQIDCVAHQRRAVRHSLGRARRLLRGNFLRVYGSVVGIQLLLVAVSCLLLALWVKLPHEAVGTTFVIGQVVIVLWLASRLWQKAAETAWYHLRDVEELQSAPVVTAVDMDVATPLASTELANL